MGEDWNTCWTCLKPYYYNCHNCRHKEKDEDGDEYGCEEVVCDECKYCLEHLAVMDRKEFLSKLSYREKEVRRIKNMI